MHQCLFLVAQDATELLGEYLVRAVVVAETAEEAIGGVLGLSEAFDLRADESRLSAVNMGRYEPTGPVEAVFDQQSALIICWQEGEDDGR